MLQLTWLFIGALAAVATVLTLTTTDGDLGIIGGLIGTISWLLWAYSALNVVVITNGEQIAQQYPSLAVFGVLMAVPNLFVALTGPLQIARDRGELTDEMQ